MNTIETQNWKAQRRFCIQIDKTFNFILFLYFPSLSHPFILIYIGILIAQDYIYIYIYKVCINLENELFEVQERQMWESSRSKIK